MGLLKQSFIVFFIHFLMLFKVSEGHSKPNQTTKMELFAKIAGSMSEFFGLIFFWKRAFCLFALPQQTSLLTIPNEKIFFKTQCIRIYVTVGPSESLE